MSRPQSTGKPAARCSSKAGDSSREPCCLPVGLFVVERTRTLDLDRAVRPAGQIADGGRTTSCVRTRAPLPSRHRSPSPAGAAGAWSAVQGPARCSQLDCLLLLTVLLPFPDLCWEGSGRPATVSCRFSFSDASVGAGPVELTLHENKWNLVRIGSHYGFVLKERRVV